MTSSFDQTLPMILYRALDAVMPDYRKLFARHDLTEQQWRVLRVLWEVEQTSSAELSNRTLLPAPSMVGIIDRLEKRGLVARVRSSSDRRVVYVTATDDGLALGAQVVPHVAAINDEIRSRATDDQWAAMEDLLRQVCSPSPRQPAMPTRTAHNTPANRDSREVTI